MWAIASTWKMSHEGALEGANLLKKGESSIDSVVKAILNVESNPSFTSVGRGGLLDQKNHLSLDGAIMDDALRFGAVAALENIQSPILVARKLLEEYPNNFLVSTGAYEYARKHGFEHVENRTASSYLKTKELQEISAYDGHDTVCVLALDENEHLCVGTSTSGLANKKHGRIGDTPIIGSGFYALKGVGAACATGLGEDIMKGCLSSSILFKIKAGYSAQDACESSLNELCIQLKNCGNISVLAITQDGSLGVASNTEEFCFIYGSSKQPIALYGCTIVDSHTQYFEIT